ncbi:MAG: hypothetical protein BWY31_03497 [Lentisphaerae bacterium ADurb.Bin242]|nr:MAG: hypothetical protein BWY31_03497 [Lentisphaerae bacterium ADurb.Bin242]
MFWEKCGRILTLNGTVTNCRDCPCGYWGLFAFVIRSYSKDTGVVDFCGPYVMVDVKNVVDSKLRFSGYMYERCIEVNRLPDSEGRHGYVKSCEGCWENCEEWDETGENCLRTGEYCDDCSEIEVYRIGSCFDTMNELAAFFYEPCGVEPDETGVYPSLTETYYGYTTLSETARLCVESHWQAYAERFIPRIDMTYTLWQAGIFAFMNSQKNNEIPHEYTWCDGECAAYGDSGCLECDGTMHTETYYDYEYVCEADFVTTTWNPTSSDPYFEICRYTQSDPDACDCANYWAGASTALGQVNAAMDSYLSDYTKWGSSDTTLTGQCLSFSYNSEWQPGECWASWAVPTIFRKWARKAKVMIERHSTTPAEALGVVADVYATLYLGTDAGCSQEVLKLSDGTQTIYSGETRLLFGQELDLPVADNMTPIGFHNAMDCEGSGNLPEYTPYVYEVGCGVPARVTFSITVRKYIY